MKRFENNNDELTEHANEHGSARRGRGMRKAMSAIVALLLAAALCVLPACGSVSGDSQNGGRNGAAAAATSTEGSQQSALAVDEAGSYTSKDEVALYIHEYGHLPSNYITKTKAKKAGWVASEGNLQEVCPGKSIGGSQYYDYDGQLPSAKGRTWTECDIDYKGGTRGAKRIVFSNDGLVFYTPDHYETFEQLY